MQAIVSTLAWASVTAYGIWRFALVLERFAPVHAVVEQGSEDVVVPDDLVAFAMQEREPWAQQEVVRAIRERYDDLKDWNRVRSAVGIGRIDQ